MQDQAIDGSTDAVLEHEPYLIVFEIEHREKMKIALLHPQLNYEGGADRQILQLAVNLQKMGNEVSVFARFIDKDKCYPKLCYQLDMWQTSIEWLKPRSPLKEFILKYTSDVKRMVKFVKNVGPWDVIIAQDDPTHWVAVKAADGTKAKTYWMRNDRPWWFMMEHLKEYQQFASTKPGIIRKIMAFVFETIDIQYTIQIDQIMVLDNKNKTYVQDNYGKEAIVVRSGPSKEFLKMGDR